MNVIDFDTDKGLYVFELDAIETEFHSHPAMELVFASAGSFSLSTPESHQDGLSFAVIAHNVKHKLSAAQGKLRMVMIEHNAGLIGNILSDHAIVLQGGCYCEKSGKNQIGVLHQLKQLISTGETSADYDNRIERIVNYLKRREPEYHTMMGTLMGLVALSESRISHLFRKNVGLSLKKYLVWQKLKLTIEQHLYQKDDLFTALMNSGFYDQPHFIKAFKSLLGVTPAKTYNSRTVQSFSDSSA